MVLPSETMLHDLAATEALAGAVARLTRKGDAILLDGPLGAGKTAFARAFLRAVANDPTLDVPSPTFTLVQTYETPRFVAHHFDLWRLDGPAGLHELGWDEARDDVVIVEWPDRLGALRPADALAITFAPVTFAPVTFAPVTFAPVETPANAPPETLNEARHALLTGWSGRSGSAA